MSSGNGRTATTSHPSRFTTSSAPRRSAPPPSMVRSSFGEDGYFPSRRSKIALRDTRTTASSPSKLLAPLIPMMIGANSLRITAPGSPIRVVINYIFLGGREAFLDARHKQAQRNSADLRPMLVDGDEGTARTGVLTSAFSSLA